MPGTISFDGLATGINTTDTVDKLMEVESRPKILKEAEKVRYENQQTSWQEVDTRLLALREQARDLWKSVSWNSVAATSSDDTVLTATATSTATTGTYTFQVTQLAQNHQVASEAFAAQDDLVGSGQLTLTIGDASTTVTLAGTESLSDLADAINAQTDVAVSASILQDASGYRLFLSSGNSGEANAISLQRDAGVTIFDDVSLGVDAGGGVYYDEVEAAQDAQIRFGSGSNPITINSAANTVANAIPGVTLNLMSAKPGSDVTLTLARDSSGMEEKLQAFVDAYNDAMSYMREQTAYDEETETRGVLMGDPTIRTIQDRIQNVMVSAVETGGPYKTLRSVGISLEDDGTLSFDATRFATAMQTDHASVEAVFRASDGVSERLSEYLGDLTEPFGTIDRREDAIRDSIQRIQNRIDEMEERLERKRESLLEKFYRMESMVGEFNSQSNYLLNTLAGLNRNWQWNA